MLGSQHKVIAASTALVLLISFGTAGYMLLEGWNWFDSLYMTVITLATVGYSELNGLSPLGRAFTMILIISGVGVGGYALTILAQSIVQGELRSTLKRRRMLKQIAELSNHFIICGSGRVGEQVARQLASEKVSLIVIDRDEGRAEFLAKAGLLAMNGDATTEEVLLEAGIKRARGLVCALPSDADNVYVTLTARDLSESLFIVSRINDMSATAKMLKAGANRTISPMWTGAHQITQALLRPTVADFIEIATKTEGLDLSMEEVLVKSESTLNGKTLLESRIRGSFNVIVISIKREHGELLFNPDGNTRIHAGDVFIVIGKKAAVDELARVAGPE